MRHAMLILPVLAITLTAHAQQESRRHFPLQSEWSFYRGQMDPADAASASPSGDWQPVTVPHTWNRLDGQDGGNDYARTDGWYRRTINVAPEMKGKSLYLRFEGVNRTADVYLNGKLLGSHAGGNSAFCFDATAALRPGDNLLAVRASNADRTIPPLSADFTFFGGIYRPVELVAVSPLHISLTQIGSSGVFITTPRITDASSTIHIRALVENGGEEPRFKPFAKFAIRDALGKAVAVSTIPLTAKPGESQEVVADITMAAPHLWNGLRDPYLYTASVTLMSDDNGAHPDVYDTVTQPFGIRTFSIDPQKGFLLNGKPYGLHGVNRHQDRLDKGWALTNDDHLQDMALIKEMGCTAIRLAHYQQSQFFYDLCDKEGLIVWAEIPVVDRLGNAQFLDNARQQYTELIRQNFNHPSICFWSAGNEVDPRAVNASPADPVSTYFRTMRDLAHTEDPSRPSVSAWREKFFPPPDAITDYFALNEYLGWYTPINDWSDLETYIARHSQNGAAGKWAITEYGAGASIFFHSEHPQRMDHSEEYQALLHENTWRILKQHPEIWGKFIWNMFDFAVDGRAEGDHAGRNDKGLVTYDRKVKKDAFYFYKASWSAEPALHLASKRFTTRGIDHIPIKAYSNALSVSIIVNGQSLGERRPDNATVLWENVALKEGPNSITAFATFPAGKTLTDTATWTYTPGAPAEVDEPQDARMKSALEKGPPRAR
jgi:beta-galactosidase